MGFELQCRNAYNFFPARLCESWYKKFIHVKGSAAYFSRLGFMITLTRFTLRLLKSPSDFAIHFPICLYHTQILFAKHNDESVSLVRV